MPPDILITHARCSDGALCAYMAQKAWGLPTERIFRVAPDEAALPFASLPAGTRVFLADVSLPPETAEDLARRYPIHIFDHHRSALPLSGRPYATIDMERCGSRIFLEEAGLHLPELRDTVLLIDDQDRWVRRYPASQELSLLIRALGEPWLFARLEAEPLRSLEHPWNPVEEAILRGLREALEGYVARAREAATILTDWQGRRVAVLACEQHVSEVGHALSEQADYAALFNWVKGAVSLRSGGTVDCSEVAGHFGGGGHAGAAGFRAASFDHMLQALRHGSAAP